VGVGAKKVPRVIELALMGKGCTEIGKVLGVSPQAVHQTLKDPDVVAQIDDANEQGLRKILHQRSHLAALAVGVLAELAEGRPYTEHDDDTGEVVKRYEVADMVRKGAADSLADRMGITKETAVKVTGKSGVIIDASGMSAEQLREALGEDDDHS